MKLKVPRVPSHVDLLTLLGDQPLRLKVRAREEAVAPADALRGKHVLLLFGAYARGDTFMTEVVERLRQVYHRIDKTLFEVVFVFNCRENEEERAQNEGHFQALYSVMPWAALPFADARREALRKLFRVEQLPKGIMLDPDGDVLSRRAVQSLLLDNAGAKWPWGAKPQPSCFALGP